MSEKLTVLLVGGTGRTGQHTLEQLLKCGTSVRAIVRSPHKLPVNVSKNPKLSIIEASLLSLSDDALQSYISGCDAVISCLGHDISFRGIFFPPRDLVTKAATRMCRGIEAMRPAKPIKFILMSSVSVDDPKVIDTRRGMFEKAFMWIIRCLIPPAKDNQQAADFLCGNIGTDNAFVQWTVVRPDTLLKGPVSEYRLKAGLVGSLFAPDSTNMANVAHLMCELVTNSKVWNLWKGKLPVIFNAVASKK